LSILFEILIYKLNFTTNLSMLLEDHYNENTLMKPNAVIVNTAGGGIVHEAALADSLESTRILGAGPDVFENEPIEADSRLLKLKNVILAPHSAADTFETTRKVSMAATVNLLKGLGL
jgi:phosphoglycerate dehydrogenase-like enzyme